MKKILYMSLCIVIILAVTGLSAGAQTIRVGLVRNFEGRNSISISTNNIDVGRGLPCGSFDFSRSLQSSSGFTVSVESGQVVIRAGGQTVFTFTNDVAGGRQVRASSGTLALGSYSYRGVVEFRPSGGRVSAINVICVEQYLYGVVAMEMAPSFYAEALRAQAVAARTFAMYSARRGRYVSREFDICDRTCCQAYNGSTREFDANTRAVRDTNGLIIVAPGGNIPLFTPYFSSSGGSTDNSENVWFEALPHLRGVVDGYERVARTWTRTYTWAQLTNAVRAEAPNANIGTVTGVIIEQEHLGRVQELTFVGTNGRWTARREQTMGVFRHIDSRLLSRSFYIVGAGASGTNSVVSATDGFAYVQLPASNLYAVDAAGNVVPVGNAMAYDGVTTRRLTIQATTVSGGTGITINGRGWGHGVGMSQNGANGMAQAGYNFRAILHHFYTGIEIRGM